MRELARDLVINEQMLDAIKSAPAAPIVPLLKTETTEGIGEATQNYFSIRNVPTIKTVLSPQLTQEHSSLLDRLRINEDTALPSATQMLQSNLTKLNKLAMSFSDDIEFQDYVQEYSGIHYPTPIYIQPEPPGTAPDVDVHGRITPLGIGDLKVVKQTLLSYAPGEVAHIENVLKGEMRERKHRRLDRTETTIFSSEEETKDSERDTQSTERFELKNEIENTIKEDMSIKAGLTVTANLGPVITTATGDYAYSTSKQDSYKSSSNFARELVDRSVSKVQSKTKIERTTKTLSEVEEINTHGVNNTNPGNDHVVGIYRWVDKRYRAQVYNYGVRLLLEFIVPEPASFYRAAQLQPKKKSVNATPPMPFTESGKPNGTALTVKSITEANYLEYVSRYNVAGVNTPPPIFTYKGVSLSKEGLEYGKSIGMTSKEFIVPEGYKLYYYNATVSTIYVNHGKFALQVGRDNFTILNVHPDMDAKMSNVFRGELLTGDDPAEYVGDLTDNISVTVTAYDVLSFAVNVQGICKLTDTHLDKWKIETFDKIYSSYQAMQTAYDQKVTQADAVVGFMIEGENPTMNRIIEKRELKKLCITMMTGEHFSQFNAMKYPPSNKPENHPEVNVYEALQEGPIVQFFEEAFEWEKMTYLFYPYFWGFKKKWFEVSQLTDPDPLFEQFLTAGYARIVVPVPLAYRKAVEYLLQSDEKDLRKKVWLGGDRPTINDPLYTSITEELRDQTDDLAGATPEGEPWEYTLPTTLVWLQPDSQLPVFP